MKICMTALRGKYFNCSIWSEECKRRKNCEKRPNNIEEEQKKGRMVWISVIMSHAAVSVTHVRSNAYLSTIFCHMLLQCSRYLLNCNMVWIKNNFCSSRKICQKNRFWSYPLFPNQNYQLLQNFYNLKFKPQN